MKRYSLKRKSGKAKKAALISTKTAIEEVYERTGALKQVSDSMNYGKMLSSNRFANERMGIVSGSSHPGDDVIKKWAAFIGEAAIPNRNKETGQGFGMSLSYDPIGDEILHHYREDQVFQAMIRFGRAGQGATVILNTLAIPDWLEPDEKIEVNMFMSKEERKVVDHLRTTGRAFTNQELATETGVARRTISDYIPKWRKEGFVKTAGTDANGILRHQWDNSDTV